VGIPTRLLKDADGNEVIGKVTANPASNTLLDRLKALLTGIVLAAGTNVIGKLAANSGVDIGDVDVLSVAGEKYTTPTHTQPSIGATTTVALVSNTDRLYALFINDSNETIYLKLGANAVMNQGIRLNANGGSYGMSKLLGNLYTGAINGICASGSKVLLVTEGV